MKLLYALALLALCGSTPAIAAPEPQKMLVEIYRVAPGKHE